MQEFETASPETHLISVNEQSASIIDPFEVENNNQERIAEVINVDFARRKVNETIAEEESEAEVITDEPERLNDKFSPATVETNSPPLYRPRAAKLEDISRLVDIDISSFGSVYRESGRSMEEIRDELEAKFRGRFDKVGGDWIQILETVDGRIDGFTMCCPTSKPPIDFVSWEDTTDDGTLDTTYDPDGKYIYVVTLTMTPEGAKHNGQDIIFMNQIGKMVAEGYEQAYFESRIPGLRSWVKKQCRNSGLDPLELTDDDKFNYAKEYVSLRKIVNDKDVAHDRLLRIFDEVGANFLKVAPNAYKDKPSMNFGVLCTLDNPMPKLVQESRFLSKIAGSAMRLVTKYPKIMKKVEKWL